MGTLNTVRTLIFLSFLTYRTSGLGSEKSDPYVRDACSVTRYQDLCIRSLASFSRTAKRSPSKWARAGVSVTIGEAENVSQFLNKLMHSSSMKGRNKIALSDCVETFQDTVNYLHRSLGVLRKLDRANFESQMEDLTTWVSAALTDEDTCLEGFEEDQENSDTNKQIKMLQRRVSRATYITSNALAFINKLAANGLGSLNN